MEEYKQEQIQNDQPSTQILNRDISDQLSMPKLKATEEVYNDQFIR